MTKHPATVASNREEIRVAEELERTLDLYAGYVRLSQVGSFSWYRQATASWPHRPETPLSIVTWEGDSSAVVESTPR